MTRHRERRSFTVAAKSSGQPGFVTIPAKAPRMPQAPARAALAAPSFSPTPVPAAPAAVEPRRILPNLIAWEPSETEREPETAGEPPLPRVRRATRPASPEEAPRRRGRPRKTPLPDEIPVAAAPGPKPIPEAAPVAAPPQVQAKLASRKPKPDASGLRLGERWKRRLPRACW